MGVKEFFKINTWKIIICIILTILIYGSIDLFFFSPFRIFNLMTSLVFLIISIIIGYLLACLIDYFIKSKFIKIIIAVILAIFAILIGWIIFSRSFITVCDPVHDPRVCDPVHVPE
jgi:hypothetical protein